MDEIVGHMQEGIELHPAEEIVDRGNNMVDGLLQSLRKPRRIACNCICIHNTFQNFQIFPYPSQNTRREPL